MQVDVYTVATGEVDATPCLLTTQVDRETAYASEWDNAEPPAILAEWETREAGDERLDPDADALIEVQTTDLSLAIGEPV